MPHVVVVIDPTIWYAANVVAGLRDEGVLVFNTARTPEEIAEDLRSGTHGYRITAARFELYTVDATQIAIESLGRPIPNTAAMGALSGATGLISMESIERVFQDRFDGAAAANIEAAHRARSGLRKLGG